MMSDPMPIDPRPETTSQERPWLTDGTAYWLWPAAERAGLPIMVFVPGSLAAVDALAPRYPGLRLVIDHLAIGTDLRDDAAFADLPALLRLARHPTVAVKASALPCYSTEPYPFPGLHPYIRRVFDAFGPRRTFWGTDLTNGYAKATYKQRITHFTEALDFLSEDDKDWVMGRAILERLKWA